MGMQEALSTMEVHILYVWGTCLGTYVCMPYVCARMYRGTLAHPLALEMEPPANRSSRVAMAVRASERAVGSVRRLMSSLTSRLSSFPRPSAKLLPHSAYSRTIYRVINTPVPLF